MKKLALIAASAILALMLASCEKRDYSSFIGTWGVEKIEYYNIDYQGNPIAASLVTYTYDPNDIDNGIQLIFREDKTGEMHDNDVDTIPTEWNEETNTYDSYIVNPDTTIVYTFTCSYDKDEAILYMNMVYESTLRTFSMHIENLTNDGFTYTNEYDKDYVERAYMRRLSNTPTKSAGKSSVKRQHMKGSFLSGR